MIKEISVVVPVFNESRRVRRTIREIKCYLSRNFQSYEVIFVDDGSTDETLKILKKNTKNDPHIKILTRKINRGKGHSVKEGILKAKNKFILYSDCDLATPLEELAKMVKYIDSGFDVIIASRNLKDSKREVKQTILRQILGRGFALLTQGILFLRIKDTQCGFKLFKKEVVRKLVRYQKIDRWAFDAELLYIAKKYDFKIKEVAVRWIDSRGSKLDTIKDSFRMLKELLQIRLNDLAGKYKITNRD